MWMADLGRPVKTWLHCERAAWLCLAWLSLADLAAAEQVKNPAAFVPFVSLAHVGPPGSQQTHPLAVGRVGQRPAGLRDLRDLRDLREAGRGQAEPSSRMGAKRTDGAGFEAWLALGALGFKTKFTRMQQ